MNKRQPQKDSDKMPLKKIGPLSINHKKKPFEPRGGQKALVIMYNGMLFRCLFLNTCDDEL
jgi:hypothetical protein